MKDIHFRRIYANKVEMIYNNIDKESYIKNTELLTKINKKAFTNTSEGFFI